MKTVQPIKDKHGDGEEVAFFDIVTSMSLFFMLLMSLLLLSVQPKKKNQEDIGPKSKAEYIIKVTWDGKFNSDVDVHFQDSMNHYVYYNRKQDGLLHLDRDDFGDANDMVRGADGKIIKFDYNEEIVTIRGIVPGEYTLNLHLYRYRGDITPQDEILNLPPTVDELEGEKKERPVEVTVEIIKLNPILESKWKRDFVLESVGTELHLTRFTLTDSGDIVNFDESRPVYFIDRLGARAR